MKLSEWLKDKNEVADSNNEHYLVCDIEIYDNIDIINDGDACYIDNDGYRGNLLYSVI